MLHHHASLKKDKEMKFKTVSVSSLKLKINCENNTSETRPHDIVTELFCYFWRIK